MTAYQITEDLFVQAMLHAQKRTRTIVVAVCIGVPLLIYFTSGGDNQTLASVLVVYIVFAFYFLVLAPLINKMNYQRAYRNNPLLHKTQHFEITPEEVHFKSENGESRYRLAALTRLEIYPEMVMIYPSKSIFHLIPKNVLSDSDLEILNRYVIPTKAS